MICLIWSEKCVILHFFFDQVMTKPDGGYLTDGLKGILDPSRRQFDLPEIMTAWDDMCFCRASYYRRSVSEDILSPRAKGYYEPMEGDKIASSVATSHEYFNNRMMGITMQGDLYMNATSWRTAYNPSTAADILLHIKDNSGAIWGPAHEYGHINQYPMKFAGTTEISNNVFSNVAVFYQGHCHIRADYPSRQREIFNKNRHILKTAPGALHECSCSCGSTITLQATTRNSILTFMNCFGKIRVSSHTLPELPLRHAAFR